MESISRFVFLIRAGKREAALELAERLEAAVPPMIGDAKVGKSASALAFEDGQNVAKRARNGNYWKIGKLYPPEAD